MKKVLLIVLFVLTFALGHFRVAERGNSNLVSAIETPRPSPRPVYAQKETLPEDEQGIVADEVPQVAAAPVLPGAYFPQSKVISSIELEGKRKGETRRLKVVETSLKQPFVLIEETYLGQGIDKQLIDQSAMVANQVLLRLPEDLSEKEFSDLLTEAGAVAVQPAGYSVLATFTARPEEPLALEAFIAKVKELSLVEVVIEPNYLRQII